MNDIWVASDLHLFNQENDTSHPFRSKEYIEQMTRNYHTMIQESDLFIFLGDLCDPITTTDDQWSMISNLIMGIPGRRIMCKGNHDTLDNSYYYALGFDLVCDIGHVDHMIFSHKPVRVAPDEINIHGHLHHEKDTKLGYQHLNVYNYLIQHKDSYDKPILLQDIFDAANDQNHDAEPDWGTYRPEDSKFTNLRSYLDLKKSGAYVADLSEYITIAPVDESYDVIDETVSDSALDEILFQDTDETQYWETDDDSAQKKEDAAKYGDSNPVIKQSRKNDVVAESANTSGEMKFELKTYDGQLHSLSILAKDLLHERMMIHPEEVDAEALKTFKEVDKFVNYFNNLANAEAAASLNGTEFTPGYVAGYSILRENNRGIKDDTITNTLLPIYNDPDKLQQYVSDSIQFLAKIETAVCGLIGSHIAAIRESINIAYQESMSPTGRKELIQETKKFLDSKETQDKIVQIHEFYARPEHKTTPEKCKTVTFDYNAVNLDRRVIISGDMYGNPSLKNLMVPSRFLVRLAVYDVIIVAHGASADQNRWVIEPIWLEMNNQYTTSLDDVVRYCKKYYGSKKILVLSCNPDHIIPDNKLYDVVDYASNTVLFEGAMTVTPSMTPNIDQTLDQLIEYLAQKIKALNHLKAQILSQIDDLDLMAYPRELKYVYIDKTSATASIQEKSISGSKQFNTAIGETTRDLFQYYEMALFQFRMLMKHIRNRDRKLLKENVMFWNDGNYTLWNTVCGIPSLDTKYEFRCDPTLGYRYNDINEMAFDMELYQVSAMGSNGATTCPHEGLPEGLHSQLVERISNLNSIDIDESSHKNTSGEMTFDILPSSGTEPEKISILAKDLLHEKIMINPEEIDIDEIKTIKEVDTFIDHFNTLAAKETTMDQHGKLLMSYTPGAFLLKANMDAHDSDNFDKKVLNALLPIGNTPDSLWVYIDQCANTLNRVEQSICGLVCSQLALTKISIAHAYKESVDPNGRKALIKEAKNYVDSIKDDIIKIHTFEVRNPNTLKMEKRKTYEFNYIHAGMFNKVYVSDTMYHQHEEHMKPSRFLVRLSTYNTIIIAHGGEKDGKRIIEPIWVPGLNQYTTDPDVMVQYCRNANYGRVLLMSCNPGHIVPDSKLYDVVDYPMNSDMFESNALPVVNQDINQTLNSMINYSIRRIKDLNRVETQVLSMLDDLDLMVYPREMKCIEIDTKTAVATIQEKSINGSKQFNTTLGMVIGDLFSYYKMVVYHFMMIIKHLKNRSSGTMVESGFYWKNGDRTIWNTLCLIAPEKGVLYETVDDPTFGYVYDNINEMTFDMELYRSVAGRNLKSYDCRSLDLSEAASDTMYQEYRNTQYIPHDIDEASKEYKNYDNIRPMEKEEKKKVADKYGLRVVGGESPAEIEDRRKTPEQRYNERREKQLQDLKRARKIKKRKAFVRKVKSHLPGAKNEDATVVDEPNIPDSNVEHSPLYGDKADFFYNYDYPKSANTYAERLKLEEAAIKRVSDDGTTVPEKCPKCGSKVGLYLKGEPVWLCSNKDCGKYFGTAPCNKAASKPVEDEPITKAELSKLGIRDLRTFQRWLKNNIKYENMTKLKSPREVMESKHGCCHDQVIFELDVLRTLGYKPRAYFAIEFNDTQGGETHSYVIVEDHGKMYWLENAWGRYAGLNEVDRSTFLKQAHEERVWGDINRFPDIEIKRFVGTPGDDLQTVVDRSLNDKKPMDESTLGNLVRDTPAIMNNMFANAMYTGKWDKVEAGLTKLIQSADSIDRINYLRRDFRYGVTSMTKLLEKMKQVQRGELANKDIEKRIAGGNTPEKMQAHIKWIKTVGYPMLNQRAKEIRAANKAKLMETYQFELIGNQVLFIDKDSALTEAKTAEKKVPVYIVLVHSGTAVSNAIKTISHSEFSHASISFDSSLEKMYSFARKDPANPFIGGFRYETIGKGFYDKKEIPYAVYMVSCTENQVKKMKKRLNYFIQNEAKFKFDFGGLVKNYLGIVDNPEYRWFCSRFVADILNAGAPKNNQYVKEPSLQDPDDFKNMEQAHLVINGDNLMKYDRKLVDRRTKKILREEQLGSKVQNESAVLDVDGMSLYESIVLDYHMNHLSENVLEDFYQYMKSFKIKYDNQGNIIIRRREYDQLDAHYRNSLKLIKAAEKAGDLNTVKDELCKLHYMINLISGQYLRKKASPKSDKVKKEMMDLRAVMMNVFTQHLKYVMTHDPSFNFNAYYNTTKYSQDVVVNQAAVSAIGKSIATALL